MFCAENIALDEGQQQQNHVCNLLVTLKHLSANKLRHRKANLTIELAPQPVTDIGWLTRNII